MRLKKNKTYDFVSSPFGLFLLELFNKLALLLFFGQLGLARDSIFFLNLRDHVVALPLFFEIVAIGAFFRLALRDQLTAELALVANNLFLLFFLGLLLRFLVLFLALLGQNDRLKK